MRAKPKPLTCGHEQMFATPQPREWHWVWCRTCDSSVQVKCTRRKVAKHRVAEGRPRRLKTNPRSNNQYTKGRNLEAQTSG